jgi:aerobic-type carbon monoxide dehydrogenase small subunit (CoxS/CutS family)/carbon monoxide dehydrogenase subunit G
MTPPRALAKVAPDDAVEVTLTVNGTPTRLAVPARLTLADALRDHLGLTGTHLGCEHGVCGMCTVLVDGEAARACLLFACQVDGSDVVTVEGLGRPDDLHPLQEAFGRHHGLQCGFCTPGFLLSSYDLLNHEPAVKRDDLPEELSGVICRCTGYRNIIDAVADVAEQHPDGLPGPRNCATRTLVGRTGAVAGNSTPQFAEPPAAEAPPGEARPSEIILPTGEPTIHVDITTDLDARPDDVAAVLADIPLLARCLPGAELTEDLGDGWYRGRAGVALGPVRLSFSCVAQVAVSGNDYVHAVAQGSDASGGRAQADIRLRAEPGESGTRLHADAAVFLTGRIAQFGRSLAGDVSRRMFEQFAKSVESVANGADTVHSPTPPSALRLLGGTVRDRLRQASRRWRQRRHQRKRVR